MIKLNVDPYCHSCDKFEPVAEKEIDYDYEDNEYISGFEVHCAMEDLCRHLWEHMRTEGRR